jgi:hypothetical protein
VPVWALRLAGTAHRRSSHAVQCAGERSLVRGTLNCKKKRKTETPVGANRKRSKGNHGLHAARCWYSTGSPVGAAQWYPLCCPYGAYGSTCTHTHHCRAGIRCAAPLGLSGFSVSLRSGELHFFKGAWKECAIECKYLNRKRPSGAIGNAFSSGRLGLLFRGFPVHHDEGEKNQAGG